MHATTYQSENPFLRIDYPWIGISYQWGDPISLGRSYGCSREQLSAYDNGPYACNWGGGMRVETQASCYTGRTTKARSIAGFLNL